MPRKAAIPDEVRQRAQEVVARFNAKYFGKQDICFVLRFRGSFLYLDRSVYGTTGPISRLRYTGKFNDWEFAIYKYSSDSYDSDEWWFPGSDEVDGTLEGAMKAGMQAYPP